MGNDHDKFVKSDIVELIHNEHDVKITTNGDMNKVKMVERLSNDLATTISSWSISAGMQTLVDAELEKFEKERLIDIQKRLEEEENRSKELEEMEMKATLNICQQLSSLLINEVTVAGMDHTVENILPIRIVAAALQDEITRTTVKKIA